MKKFNVLALVAIVVIGIAFTSCDSKKSIGNVKLSSAVDSVSYIAGKAQIYFLLKNVKPSLENWPEKGNYDAFLAGMNDAFNNPSDSMFLGKSELEFNEYINSYFQRAQVAAADKAKADGEAFLAENKAKSGVITTPSGLQYKVITEGTGAKPSATDIVKVHYTGTFLDGTKFDSTADRGGEPAEFPVGNVIPGWTEGLQIMPVGSKYTFWIPAELAYGMNPPSQAFPMNAMLIFELELLEIVTQ